MFAKHVSELTYEDIEDLVKVRQEGEGYHLDYKSSIGDPQKAKTEFAKDVTAFANSSGGYLIFGVKEDTNEINGIPANFQSKGVAEWMNQVLHTNAEPKVFYHDPKVIPVPGTEKVVVVLHIPESTKKPHMVNESGNYYVRMNDSCKIASHYMVRDMFEFARRRTDEFNEFLQKRNLLDEESESFGITRNSKELYSEIVEKVNKLKPLILFSLIPKFPYEQKVNLPLADFRKWLEDNDDGYFPSPSSSVYHSKYDYELRLDGIVARHTRKESLISYFEVSESGYIEAGFSSTATYLYSDRNDEIRTSLHLTTILGYEMILLGWAKRFYEMANYYDEVLLQISFANVQHYKLVGFSEKYRDTSRYDHSDISNKQHNNFKLSYRFLPSSLTDEAITEIVKSHSERLCRVFGLERDFGFNDDNQINVRDFNHYLF
jgi:hypothetical protein